MGCCSSRTDCASEIVRPPKLLYPVVNCNSGLQVIGMTTCFIMLSNTERLTVVIESCQIAS